MPEPGASAWPPGGSTRRSCGQLALTPCCPTSPTWTLSAQRSIPPSARLTRIARPLLRARAEAAGSARPSHPQRPISAARHPRRQRPLAPVVPPVPLHPKNPIIRAAAAPPSVLVVATATLVVATALRPSIRRSEHDHFRSAPGESTEVHVARGRRSRRALRAASRRSATVDVARLRHGEPSDVAGRLDRSRRATGSRVRAPPFKRGGDLPKHGPWTAEHGSGHPDHLPAEFGERRIDRRVELPG